MIRQDTRRNLRRTIIYIFLFLLLFFSFLLITGRNNIQFSSYKYSIEKIFDQSRERDAEWKNWCDSNLEFQSRPLANRIRRRCTAWRNKKRQTYPAKWTRTPPRFNSVGPSTIPPRVSTWPPVISPGPAHPPSSRTHLWRNWITARCSAGPPIELDINKCPASITSYRPVRYLYVIIPSWKFGCFGCEPP